MDDRLKGLGRLRHIPLDPIRSLLRLHGATERQLRGLGAEELARLCDGVPSINQDDVERLYAEHRYSARPQFHLRLLPHLAAPPDVSWRDLGVDAPERATIRGLSVTDLELFDGYQELRVRYQHAYEYLDEEEYSQRIWETRFAFVWVHLEHAFIAVMAGDEAIVEPLVAAVGEALGVIPLHPSLTPAIVDSFAKPSSAARRRFVAADGVTRCSAHRRC